MGRNKSRQVALGGICAALSVVIMLISSIIPLATYIAPMLAGIALLPMREEMGTKNAFMCYIACSFICIFLVAEKECVMMYVFLLGWYPVFKDKFDGLKGKLSRILLKLAVFNISVAAGYFVIIKLFSMDYIMEEFGGRLLLSVTVVLGNIAFLLYDKALVMMKRLYYLKLRKMLGLR